MTVPSPDRPAAEAAVDVAAIVEKRTRGWLPIDEWGPVCAGCGDTEFRIDGYCSCECRDYHDDEDIAALAARLSEAEKALREICAVDNTEIGLGAAYAEINRIARSALPGFGSGNTE